jgi:hypothetical protein
MVWLYGVSWPSTNTVYLPFQVFRFPTKNSTVFVFLGVCLSGDLGAFVTVPGQAQLPLEIGYVIACGRKFHYEE